MAQTLVGIVSSDKRDKTITVSITSRELIPYTANNTPKLVNIPPTMPKTRLTSAIRSKSPPAARSRRLNPTL